MSTNETEIHIGVAGWDYPDWRGRVYPLRGPRGFDRLAYLASFVDVIEINSSFYRPVAPATAASWARRTRDLAGFHFTAKGHRSWTHEREIDLDEVVPPALSGLAPLREAGRLGALLLQFPQSFHFEPASLERLARLLDRLEGWPSAVEVRHRSWERPEGEAWFRERNVSLCAVDQPQVGRSTARRLPRVTGGLAYLRLHGRNAADWFRPDAGRDARYDYLYAGDELRDLADTARRMAELVPRVFVVQNNHFRGQALVNALQMKALLQPTRPAAPRDLVAAYPDLAPFVRPEAGRLF